MITEKTYNRESGNIYKKICFIDNIFITESKTKSKFSEEALMYEIQTNLRVVGSKKIIKVYKRAFYVPEDINKIHFLENEFNYLYNDTGNSIKQVKDIGKHFVIWMKKENDEYLLSSDNGRSIYKDNFINSLITHLNIYSEPLGLVLMGPGCIITLLLGIPIYVNIIIGIILFGIGKIKQLV